MANTGGRYGQTHHVWHMAAATFAVLKKPAQAVDLLRKARGLGLLNYPLFRNDPHFKPLHADPPFLGMLADLREWRAAGEFGRPEPAKKTLPF